MSYLDRGKCHGLCPLTMSYLLGLDALYEKHNTIELFPALITSLRFQVSNLSFYTSLADVLALHEKLNSRSNFSLVSSNNKNQISEIT